MHHKAANGERASCYVNIFVICLVVLAVIQTITCKSNYRGRSSKLQSTTNISCLYSEFKTITCTWSLKECYKNDYSNPLDIEESVHIHYTFNVSTSQYCYRDTLVYLQCVCLQSGETKCSWSHKSSQASESLSLSVAVHDSVTSKQLLSRNEQFELLDIVKPSPVNNLAVENDKKDGCLLVKWDFFQRYTDYVCELTARSYYQKMTKSFSFLHERPMFPMICNLHPHVETLLEVRCRVMVMETERGFWSNLSIVPIKIENKGKKGLRRETHMETNLNKGMVITLFSRKIDSVRTSDTYSLNVKSYTMWAIVTLGTLCFLIGLSVLVMRNAIANTNQSTNEEHICVNDHQMAATIHEGKQGLLTQTHIETNPTERMVNTSFSRRIVRVEKLLQKRNLPNNKDLQFIFKYNVGEYKRVNVVFEKICKIIRNKLGNEAVKNIWPARTLANDNIAFVVELAKEAAVHHTFQHDLEVIYYHCDSTAEKESSKIMSKEREFLKNKTDEYRENLKKLYPILKKHSKQLMDKHKNITAILPCVIKSKGYGTPDKHLMIETLCISIHVNKKISGLLPLNEEPISTKIEDIPTDVVQGKCRLFSNGPHDYHSDLKMGLAIRAQINYDKGAILGGTLGCFMQHKTYGLCCITCAHVVLPRTELDRLFRSHDGYKEYEQNSLPVFQPIHLDTSPFGRVVAAAGKNGNVNCPGVEVALIKILNRQPVSGSFPQSASGTVPIFTFNTGNVIDANLLQEGVEVFKFGMKTGPTIGLLHSHGILVNYNQGIQLHQQIVVIPATDETFAAQGDSGSSVFIGFSRPGRESVIGLVSGGEDDGSKVFVTPIYDICKSIKCQPCLHRFKNSDDNGIFMSMPTQCASGEEPMDCNN